MANTRSGQTNSSDPRREAPGREAAGGHRASPQAGENLIQPPPALPPRVNGGFQDIPGNPQNISVGPLDSYDPMLGQKLGKGLPPLPPDPKRDTLELALWVRQGILWAQSIPLTCERFVSVLLHASIFKGADRIHEWFKVQQRLHAHDHAWDAWTATSHQLMAYLNGNGYPARLFAALADLKQAEDEEMIAFLERYRDAFTAAFPGLSIDKILVTDVLAKVNSYGRSYVLEYLEHNGHPRMPDIEDIFATLQCRSEAIANKVYARGFEPAAKVNDPCPVVAQVHQRDNRNLDSQQSSYRIKNQRSGYYGNNWSPQLQPQGGRPKKRKYSHRYDNYQFRQKGSRGPQRTRSRGQGRRSSRGSLNSRNNAGRPFEYQNDGQPPQQGHHLPRSAPQQQYVQQVSEPTPAPQTHAQELQQPQFPGYSQDF